MQLRRLIALPLAPGARLLRLGRARRRRRHEAAFGAHHSPAERRAARRSSIRWPASMPFGERTGRLRIFFAGRRRRARRGDEYLRLRVDDEALLAYPDGTPFAEGDSVLITVRVVDPARLLFEFEPAGLTFSPRRPAELKIRYDKADDDLDEDGDVDLEDDDLELTLAIWRQESDGDPFVRLGSCSIDDRGDRRRAGGLQPLRPGLLRIEPAWCPPLPPTTSPTSSASWCGRVVFARRWRPIAAPETRAQRADARLLAATAATRLGELELAETLAGEAVRRFAERGDFDGRMRALNLLGVIGFERGQLEEAERRLTEALSIAYRLEDSLLAARACNNLASVAHLRGRPEEAVGLYRGALLGYQRLGDRRGTAETYHNLGLTYRQLADYDEAEKAVMQAVRHAESVGEPTLMALTSGGRAELGSIRATRSSPFPSWTGPRASPSWPETSSGWRSCAGSARSRPGGRALRGGGGGGGGRPAHRGGARRGAAPGRVLGARRPGLSRARTDGSGRDPAGRSGRDCSAVSARSSCSSDSRRPGPPRPTRQSRAHARPGGEAARRIPPG